MLKTSSFPYKIGLNNVKNFFYLSKNCEKNLQNVKNLQKSLLFIAKIRNKLEFLILQKFAIKFFIDFKRKIFIMCKI